MLLVKNFRCCWNLDREEEDDGRASDEVQIFFTMFENEGSISHICSNLKGLCDLLSGGSVSINMGQWSDLVRGR